MNWNNQLTHSSQSVMNYSSADYCAWWEPVPTLVPKLLCCLYPPGNTGLSLLGAPNPGWAWGMPPALRESRINWVDFCVSAVVLASCRQTLITVPCQSCSPQCWPCQSVHLVTSPISPGLLSQLLQCLGCDVLLTIICGAQLQGWGNNSQDPILNLVQREAEESFPFSSPFA